MTRRIFVGQSAAAISILGQRVHPDTTQYGLVGHWPLKGDAQDRSGCGNHGRVHGSGPAKGEFDGRTGFIEVPPSASLNFGAGDFTLCARIWNADDTNGVRGDLLCQYEPVRSRGLNLNVTSSAGGYSSHGDDRHLFFGIDDARISAWEDCGRPSATSNYVSNSLTVFNGSLFAATTDAAKEEDWGHVFRYRGGQRWEDCGRVGTLKARGVGPMIVHKGSLYAATWNYDWTRVGVKKPGEPTYEADFCRVYRYASGRNWEDCGQPGECRRLFGLASYRGRLFVTAEDGRCYVHDGKQTWTVCGRFPNYAHPMGVHGDRLYAGVLNPAGIWEYDGSTWKPLGNPQGSEERCNQIHAIGVYRSKLHVTTWPEGHVLRLDPNGKWTDCGRLGDAMEINGLVVYNGKLYGGSIPRAEVFRYEAEGQWTSVGQFLKPANYSFKDSTEWARVTSLTVYAGKLFASMGSCTSSHLDAPADFRGKVFALQQGQCISYDRDIGPGWKHIAAIRRGSRLEIYVDGSRVSQSPAWTGSPVDLENGASLRIGMGETAHFRGRMQDVRAYNRSLKPAELQALAGGSRVTA